MKKEDTLILEKCGNRRPFTTPEGYFDNLTANIMAALPEIQHEKPAKVTPWTRMKVWVYAAASFIGMFFIINTAVSLTDGKYDIKTAEAPSQVYSDEYIESFFETAMVDEYTLYCSLTNTGGFNHL